MRTTVTLEPDVAAKPKELAHQRRASFKATLNEVLRRGLAPSTHSRKERQRFTVQAHAGGFRPGVDPDRLSQLLDELAADAFADEARTAG